MLKIVVITERISSQALNTYKMKHYLYLVIAGACIVLLTGITLVSAENTELVDCGGTTYNPEYQSCCQGKVFEGTRYSRCGDTCYNMDNQTCCSKRVVDGPCFPECGDGYFNPSNQTCCQKHTYDGLKWGICGGTCYNLTTQSCCRGKIYEGLNWKNCGGVCFDPDLQTCCLNKVYEGKKEMKPCGRYDCYDVRNQTCSRGQISDTKPEKTTTYW